MSDKQEVGYAYNFTYDLGNGRTIGIAGNFPKGATMTDMNVEFDKVRSTLDRQQAKSALRGVEDDVDNTSMAIDDAVEDMNRIQEKENGSLTASQRQAKEAATVHVDKLQKRLVYKKSYLEKLKKECA